MSSPADNEYVKLIENVLCGGELLTTRNSECYRVFDYPQIIFTSTPLVGIRKTAWRSALREWEWFMSGSDHISYLHESVRKWWEPWVNSEGYLRYGYPGQLRLYTDPQFDTDGGVIDVDGFDQIEYLIDGLKNHPRSRRHVITTWNPAEMVKKDCKLTTCHNTVTQFFVSSGGELHLKTYQRSVDVICGLPHNWIQEWAFLMWLAQRSGYKVGSMIWIGGDIHVYKAHVELAEEILANRDAYPYNPQLVYTPTDEEFRAEDFALGSEYHPVLDKKAVMIV